MVLICFASGLTVATGIFAFLAKLGVIPRLIARTNTAKHTPLFENGIIIGGSLGNIYSLWQFKIPVGIVGLVLIGLFCGIYIGCLAMAIAGKVVERELNPKDHSDMINRFISELGEDI